MSRFVTDLDVRKHLVDTSADKRGTWTVRNPLLYASDLAGLITVPAGFVTDFASVPRIPVAFLLAGDCGQEAAVIHDFLYTTHQVDRAKADAVFQEALLIAEPRWRAWLMWAGVRLGGSRPWEMAGQRQPPHVSAFMPKAS
jgi:hypothetical protein